MPPPAFRSTVPKELGRAQVARWSMRARAIAWITVSVASYAILQAYFLGPGATLAVLAVCGLFLAAMIYLPRRLRFTRAGILWTLLSGVPFFPAFIRLYPEIHFLAWPPYPGLS